MVQNNPKNGVKFKKVADQSIFDPIWAIFDPTIFGASRRQYEVIPHPRAHHANARLLPVSERLHAAAHRRQEEPNGHWHHAAGVRRRHQRGDAAGHRPHPPGGAGGQRGPGLAAAGQVRRREHLQQGNIACVGIKQKCSPVMSLHLRERRAPSRR